MIPLGLRLSALEQRLPAHLLQWAPQFLMAELCFGVDPFLMAALCERESQGGETLDPQGPAGVGDAGHGKGLFQIDDRGHPGYTNAYADSGVPLWSQPTLNTAYAAWLYSRNLSHCGNDNIVAIAAYNCGLTRAIRAVNGIATPSRKIAALDAVTTNKYVSGVLANYEALVGAPFKGV